jgi:exoribonuclease R
MIITVKDENPTLTKMQFMLLTNQAVAQHIAFSLPEQALLRRHEDPIERRLVSISNGMDHPLLILLQAPPRRQGCPAWL